jgi:RecB family exonuclease
VPSVLQFARYREIAEEIAARLTSSQDEAIVSSGGLAASVIGELIRRSSGGVVSARLTMIDAFARRILNDAGEYPRVATDAERRLAMRAAVAANEHAMLETRGIAAMLERSYRDVRDSGLSLGEFERRCRGKSLRDGVRSELVFAVWKDYEKRIAHLRAVDSADVLQRAAALIESGRTSVASQIVAGFYDMTGAQLRLLHALEKTGKVSAILVPVGDDDAYTFATRFVKQLDSVLSPQSSVLKIKKPETRVTVYDDKLTEARAVCRSIRDLLDAGTPAERIGITARMLDPDDIRLLGRFAGELGFSISAAVETSLLAHRMGRAIATILRLREKNLPRGDVIDILRDGYLPRIRVDVDRLDVATRRARVSGGRSADIRNAANDPAIDEYRTIVAELEALSGLRSIAEHFRAETELDLAAVGEIDDVASLLARWGKPVDIETVIELLGQQTLPRQLTTDNRQPAVWVGDVMQFRGRNFDHLFVIRAQDGTLPQRRVDDPLLPDSDRRQLGIREIGDGRDEERLLFQLLLDGSGAVHFSLAGSDMFGKILRPSRMVRTVPPAECRVPSPALPLGTRHSAPGTRQLQLVVRAGTRSVFDGYLGTAFMEAIRAELQAISPTNLEDFGECPQKFLLKHLLGARDYDDPDRELQMHHREKGKLDHTILERFYKTRASLDDLDRIVDEAFDEEEQRVPAFNRVMRAIERKTTKRNLRAFLLDDLADLERNGLQPRHFEYRFGPKYEKRGEVDHAEAFTIRTQEVAIRVEGSIDRIDVGRDTIRIVDYKSGKALRHVHLAEKIDRGVRLQLALYAMAVADFFGAPSVSGAIKPLIVRGTDPDKLRFDLQDAEERLRETLELFVKSMLGGAFPAFPNDDDKDRNFNACKYCPVNHSCRTRHSDAERRHVLQSKDPRTLLEEMA